MRYLPGAIALLFLFSMPATAADEKALQPVQIAMLSVVDPGNTKNMFSIGCNNLRGGENPLTRMAPADAIRGHEDQATILELTVLRSGKVQSASTKKNSKDRELDRIAVNCAERLNFTAPVRDGVAMPSVRTWVIFWIGADNSAKSDRFPSPALTGPVTAGVPQTCEAALYPADANAASGEAQVNFIVGQDGQVAQPSIKTSSGNSSLDTASLRCVQQWRYIPAKVEGSPVGIAWTVNVKWDAASKTASSDTPTLPVPGRTLSGCVMANGFGINASFDVIVSPDGSTKDLIFADGNRPNLKPEALSCLQNVRYVPATANGLPVEKKVTITMASRRVPL